LVWHDRSSSSGEFSLTSPGTENPGQVNWNYYNEVFDPTEDNEVIKGSLADDIAGIYCDLKEGIDLKESDKVLPEDIIFEWRCGFYNHWGKHAIDALWTLHFRLNDTLTGLESI